MEEMDIDKLGFFIEEDIFLIPEDAQEILLADKFKDVAEDIPEELAEDTEETTAGAAPEETNPLPSLAYDGDFEKGLLVIHQDDPLGEDLKTFLLKILRAVSYSLKDIALVPASRVAELPPEAILQLNPHKVLVFGRLNHPIIQHKETAYEVTSDGETEFLFADGLPVIFEDESLKRQLWKSLQVLFNINK
ncbi:hypothetical protein Echvi_3723 [Echinicola vietnamensis DSM 17526]|uniref:Uncharacterized protein n=2 Tax=Echinicola TaxID=390846 RepID=L0G531_ECHVK|nr:hypothetical protein Echvi_3723 [Echinicola vietnamensis DSM 17526]